MINNINLKVNNFNKVNGFYQSKKSNKQNNNINSPVKDLMKQKEELQNQIKQLQQRYVEDNLNKDNSGIKEEGGSNSNLNQIKELQKQIEEVDKEISKMKSEKLNSKDNKDKKDKDNVKDEKEQSIEEKLVKFSGNLNNINVQTSVKRRLEDSANILETEIKLDKSRGVNTSRKEKELSNMKENIKNIGNNISEGLKGINNNKTVKPDKNEADTKEHTDENKSYDKDVKGEFIDTEA